MSISERSLLELYDVTNGLNKGKKDFGFGFPFLTFKEVFYGTFLPDGLTALVNSSEKEREKCSIKEGDVFITRTSETIHELGLTAVALKDYPEATFNGFCKRLRPKDKDIIEPAYAAYFFKSFLFRDQINSMTNMSTRASLNNEMLEKLSFRLPSIPTQRKIAATLKMLDDRIELNQLMNKTLEEMAQAIFKCWFVDFEPVKAKMAGESEESICNRLNLTPDILCLFPDTLTDSDLGPIPTGWRAASISDTARVVMGQSPKGDTYNENADGTMFFQGRAEFTTRFPRPRLYTTDPKRMARKGDALISVRAPVGDLNMAMDDCCIGRGLSAIRHNSGSSSYTYYWIHSLQSTLDEYNGEGTVFGSINKKTLEGLGVAEPAPELIAAYDQVVSIVDHKIEILSYEIQTLSELRDTLLPKLLSGELSVENIELETN